MNKRFLGLLLVITLAGKILAQGSTDYPDTIHLQNASFEGLPRSSMQPPGWIDCGFLGESPPDVQPFSEARAQWAQKEPAKHGLTYLGMVVRDNDTWEKVSQKLRYPIEAGKCYEFSIYIATGATYLSRSQINDGDSLHNYNKPAVLRVRGANYKKAGEILAESETISNNHWEQYIFSLKPKANYHYLMLEAYYKTPTLFPYNGNILLDNASPVVRVLCPGEEPLASSEELLTEAEEGSSSSAAGTSSKSVPEDVVEENETEVREKIMKNLRREKLKIGETIRIEKLTFDADVATLKAESYLVLNEIADFLIHNPDVAVEVGGHTSLGHDKNKKFTKDYFDKLSTNRAKTVYNYLLSKGVPKSHLSYRGYGYQKPVATNFTAEGKRRNQRVEIKILALDS